VNVSSGGVEIAIPLLGAYSSSKCGLEGRPVSQRATARPPLLAMRPQRDTTRQKENEMSTAPPAIPADDPKRNLTLAQPDNLPHIGLVGDTYTITVTGEETNGRFCLIDMHIPPGGGPPPHRHDFEETFILLEGEMEATFRGKKSVVRAGETLNIPSNAPHQFHNVSTKPVRMLCICSPAGQEKFFLEVGVPVATRTTPPPKLDEKEQAVFIEKVKALAPKYRTQLLREA
jgi:quercetin dioxygenase-like cupin family protein